MGTAKLSGNKTPPVNTSESAKETRNPFVQVLKVLWVKTKVQMSEFNNTINADATANNGVKSAWSVAIPTVCKFQLVWSNWFDYLLEKWLDFLPDAREEQLKPRLQISSRIPHRFESSNFVLNAL